MKIGLTLGSGAARGLTHIGVLKALEELNIKIDYLTGCSIGALIGGGYAMGMSINKIEDIALQTDWKRMAKIFSPTLSFSCLLNDKYLMEFLSSIFEDVRMENLKLPFNAVAADIETGKMVVIDKGSLREAIRASISIPMIFSPVPFRNYQLVDGGLVNPTPVDVTKTMGADLIIAVNLRQFTKQHANIVQNIEETPKLSTLNDKQMALNAKIEHFLKNPLTLTRFKSPHASKKEKPGMGKILYHMFIIVQNQMANLTMQIVKPDILIEPDTSAFNIYDFYKGKELIEIGYQTTMEKLSDKKFQDTVNKVLNN